MAGDRAQIWTHGQAVVGLDHKCHGTYNGQRPQSGEPNASGYSERNRSDAKMVAPNVSSEQTEQHQTDHAGESKLAGLTMR
jgi:hypothetical protein